MYSFDPQYTIDKIVSEIRRYAKEQGFSKVVVGISGGKDSTVTAALLVRALGKDNVYGVMLPDGKQADIEDSFKVCKAINIPNIVFNIGDMHAELFNEMEESNTDPEGFKVPLSEIANINVAPRLRMTVLRYITQALDARLAGTGNLSEITVGYCTKDGDTSCDFSVLGGLTSVEVVQMGLMMHEIPQELVLKTPSDGLCGMSDEEKLGISYDDIHAYIRYGTCGKPEVDTEIKRKEQSNMHKRLPPVILYSPDISELWKDAK